MLGLLIGLCIAFLLWVGFKITGALLSAVFWLLVRVPLALILWAVGILLCCTILLIPIGKWVFKMGTHCLLG